LILALHLRAQRFQCLNAMLGAVGCIHRQTPRLWQPRDFPDLAAFAALVGAAGEYLAKRA